MKPSKIHLTEPLVSIPALLDDDVDEVPLVVLDEVLVPELAARAAPITPPCTAAGATVLLTVFAAATYASKVFEPVELKVILVQTYFEGENNPLTLG